MDCDSRDVRGRRTVCRTSTVADSRSQLWPMPAVVGALEVPGYVTHRAGNAHLNHRIGIALSVAITAALVFALGALIHVLPSHRESAVDLLRSAALLWLTNILVFASWYWRLDAGRPAPAEDAGKHVEGAFLFPQMTLQGEWTPDFVDYIFLAFNTSTAFSPTDRLRRAGGPRC